MLPNDLDRLRAEINQLDHDILQLAQKRLQTVKRIGEVKNALNLPTRDFGREKQCIELAHRFADELGLSKRFAEALLQELIRESLKSQEKDRMAEHAPHNTRKALVIGGAGKMGLWFARFLDSQGFDVSIADPATQDAGFRNHGNWQNASVDQDIIVVATPMPATNAILLALAEQKPRALIFELSSLKEPVREGLIALHRAGLKACSLHPMFGPETELLSGRHVVLVDLGNAQANDEARRLFAATMATVVEMDMDEHDRVVAFLLGLSHALNIAFCTVLAQSGEDAPRLMELSSTTFNSQLDLASRVIGENPKLYYEIQALNPYGDIPLTLLGNHLARIKELVRQKDEQGFVSLMQEGYAYLQGHKNH